MKNNCLKLVLDHGTDMQKCKVRVMELRRNVAKLEDSNRNISLQWNRKKKKTYNVYEKRRAKEIYSCSFNKFENIKTSIKL